MSGDTLRFTWNLMLPGLGSNQGLQLQRLTCYHYTTGQGRKGRGYPSRNGHPAPNYFEARALAGVKGNMLPGRCYNNRLI